MIKKRLSIIAFICLIFCIPLLMGAYEDTIQRWLFQINPWINKVDPSIIFSPKDPNDTHFWVGVQDDAEGDDDDIFQIGKDIVPGTTPYITIDSTGKFGLGTTSPERWFHKITSVYGDSGSYFDDITNGYGGESLRLRKARGTPSSKLTVQNEDELGFLDFRGYSSDYYSGATFVRGATIFSVVEGSGTYQYGVPASLRFQTCASGSSAAIENMRLSPAGNLGIGIKYPSDKLDVIGNMAVANPSSLGSETLHDGTFTDETGHGQWTCTNDCSIVSNKAVWAYSSGSASTLTQTSGNFAIPAVANRWYKFTYTVSGYAGTPRPSASITTSFASVSTPLEVFSNGAKIAYFKSAASPGNFVITATLVTGQTFTLDDLSLKEIQGGNIDVQGIITGGGTTGIKVYTNGNAEVAGSLTVLGQINYGTDAGSTDAYSITISGITALTTGMVVYFYANTANTGVCTLDVDGAGALTAKSLKSLHDQDPADNYIEAGSMVHCIYDGTNFQILSPDANP